MEVENVPLCQWSMDFLGPLPRTQKGSSHILVISVLVTKWVELYPTETQTASGTVKAIMHLVLRYSVPSCILSGQGKNFMAELMKIRTSPYHARTDGQTERSNATLVQYLQKFVDEHHEDWDKHLQFAAFAYRTSKHSDDGKDQPSEFERTRNAEEWKQLAFDRIVEEKKKRTDEIDGFTVTEQET